MENHSYSQIIGSSAAPYILTAGIAAAVAGLLRLGFLANYISEPVMKGFIVGLALTIIVEQIPKLFGVPKGSGDFFHHPGTSLHNSATRAD